MGVHYPDFSIDYYFIDTATFKSKDFCKAPSAKDNCGSWGPKNVASCRDYFKNLLKEENAWMDKHLQDTKADWQIVVTNAPPFFGTWDWKHLSRKHGIDLIISSNKHAEE